MSKKQIIFVSSGSATTVSPLGSRLTINLTKPIDVYQKTLRVLNCSFWNNFQNVNSIYNNTLVSFTYNAILRTITFPAGIYSLDDINETIGEYMMNNGIPENLMLLQPDESTSRISLIVNTSINFIINFEVNNTLFKNTLGFSGSHSTSTNKVIESTGKASLFVYENVVLHVSFCGGSTIYNERAGSDIVSIMPLNGRVGELNFYEPIHPCEMTCIGSSVSSFDVYLTDQNGNELDTNTETFSATLELS